MLNRIILWSLKNRFFVIIASCVLSLYGVYSALQLPVDVFPDLNRPVVTIFAEAHGLAPEEVEARVTFPIESAVNGSTGVYRVRSVSAAGLAMIYVEFDWNEDIYRARQIVSEKLQQASETLPPEVSPILGPVSSIMGEILLVGLSSDGSVDPLELRTIADWTIRPRLLSIKGVSQVSVIGGERKEYQVLVDPSALRHHKMSFHSLEEAIADANANTTGGFVTKDTKEVLIRNIGAIQSLDDLKKVVLTTNHHADGITPQLKDIAEVTLGGPLSKRGDAGINGQPGILLSIQKQPKADTVTLTNAIEEEFTRIRSSLPPGVKIHTDIFRQASFITTAIDNVKMALKDGAILVAIILFLFLLNARTTFITLTAIPLSLLTSFVVFSWLGLTINTMTLGGLAIAIGELVDDAIVDVENVFRRLKQNFLSVHKKDPLTVVFEASSEVRHSIVNATIIVILVFIPLFAMSGVEGRLFTPLGEGYIISIIASLIVSLTVTPVLCYYLLPHMSRTHESEESFLVRFLKKIHVQALNWVFLRQKITAIFSIVFFLITVGLSLTLGKEFLPPFNEGSITISLTSPPGTSLSESNRIGAQAELALLKIPELTLIGRRTGRAELDEHAEGVHTSELEAELKSSERDKDEILSDIRSTLSDFPGISVNIGQPISHRIDHILSGVRAQIAVKIHGSDLTILRQKAVELESVAKEIPGIVDLQIEKQVLIPQIHIKIDRTRAGQYGVNSGEIAEYIETALQGKKIGQVLENQQTFDIVLRLKEDARNSVEAIREVPIDVGGGTLVPLGLLADIHEAMGPNQIVRENVGRRIVVSANVSGRDLVGAVEDLKTAVHNKVALPEGYFVSFGGQFESQSSAANKILYLGIASLLGIFVVLYVHFRSAILASQVMLAEIPFAFSGAVLGIYFTSGVFSIASLVGLITLVGIASRNGILMIDHYIHLMKHEGEKFTIEMIYRGSQERLVPVLMTALTAVLALIPILLTPGEPGREILYPVAVVIFCGLITSTLLNLAVTPLMFWVFSKKLYIAKLEVRS